MRPRRGLLVMEDPQDVCSPSSRKCHADDERQGDNPPGNCVFAPALEHGNRSNEKQTDRDHGDDFHKATPVVSIKLLD